MSSKFKEYRINAGYSIEEISKKLNIRKQYIIDLEEENYDKLPGDIYTKGYSKLYADFLGIKTKNTSAKVIEVLKHQPRIAVKSNSKNQKFYIIVSLVCLFITTFTYNFYRSYSVSDAADEDVVIKEIEINNDLKNLKKIKLQSESTFNVK